MPAFSARQFKALQTAYVALLSPLDYPDSAIWRETAAKAVMIAAEVDGVGFTLRMDDGPLLVSDGSFERKALDDYGAYYHHHNPIDLNRLTPGRRVWFRGEVLSTPEIMATEYYNDWCRPNGNLDSAGMRTRLGGTEAEESALYLSSRRPDRYRPGCRELEILAFLQPALAAGARMSLLGPRLRRDWSGVVDALPHPGILLGVSGRVLHVSQRGRDLLGADRDQAGLLSILRAWAAEFGDITGAPVPARRTLERHNGHLVVRAAILSTGPLVGPEPVVLFTAERLSPPRPTVQETLQARFFLSAREGEVAALIGEGLSTGEIADRLKISVHTARRHSEHLYSKLGVRRRAEVAALLARLSANAAGPATD